MGSEAPGAVWLQTWDPVYTGGTSTRMTPIRMTDPFIDCTSLDGQRRIRGYVLGWLERLDYGGRLDRDWPVDELACRVVAETMVEDYYAAFPGRRGFRYSVTGPLPDVTFRRCVLDFIQDMEEYEPGALPPRADAAAEEFWSSVRADPDRWGVRPERGPFVDDEEQARELSVEVIREYHALRARVAARRAARSVALDG